MAEPKIDVDEVNLEDLIVLGEDRKIPIEIEFPKPDGVKVKAKALIKQLTLKEIGDIQLNQADTFETNITILMKALFKTNGEPFSKEEILVLPVGVVNAISNKIIELSGVDLDTAQLVDF